MFNNPFDSFHNTVADAKEEREQLDRLLTISTPRERLLVAGIALLLFAVLAWLFFGDVARSLAVDGVLVAAWRKPGRGRAVRAGARLGRERFRAAYRGRDAGGDRVSPWRMEKRIQLDGEVATVAAVPVSEGLAAIGSAAPVSVYRVDIVLDERLEFASLAGRECRIVIELGGQSPVAFLQMRRS